MEEEKGDVRPQCGYPVVVPDHEAAQPCGSEEGLFRAKYSGESVVPDTIVCRKHLPNVWVRPDVESAEPL